MSLEMPTSLESLATATPKHKLTQDDALAVADEVFGAGFDNFDRMKPVFMNAGIKERRLAMPVEWYLEDRCWQERTEAYIRVATELFCEAAQCALDQGGFKPEDIDAIVTVSSTGIATPSLDARASQTMPFRPDVLRVPVFGLGCAGGVTGITIASQLAKAMPGARVLLVVVELCSLAFRFDKMTKANVIATALFGDGAAAAVLSTTEDDTQVSFGRGLQHTWPDTLNIMGWDVDAAGFEVVFDRAIPPFARDNLRPVVDGFLDRWDIAPQDISRLSFHPGGTKVLEAIETAFELQTGSLDIERRVLSDFGNMSAPTALFVLDEVLADKRAGLSILTALGPGFTSASLPVRVLQ